MTYHKLSDSRKKAISENANEYAKNNYRQITLRLSHDVADQIDNICDDEGLSRPELIKKLLTLYKSLQNNT